MQRREFFTKSFGSAGLLYGLGQGLRSPNNLEAEQLDTQSIGGKSRYGTLAYVFKLAMESA